MESIFQTGFKIMQCNIWLNVKNSYRNVLVYGKKINISDQGSFKYLAQLNY